MTAATAEFNAMAAVEQLRWTPLWHRAMRRRYAMP